MTSFAPLTPGRFLLSLCGLSTAIGGYIADWNHTHVFNPRWPPHAKFHNGQTMSMGLCLGLTTLYYTWRSPSAASSPTSSTKSNLNLEVEIEKHYLKTAALLGSLYWVTQLSAWFYPGSLAMDPEFGDGFPQFWISMAELTLVGLGFYLETGRMMRVAGEGKKSS